jgi:hypothetical protein
MLSELGLAAKPAANCHKLFLAQMLHHPDAMLA